MTFARVTTVAGPIIGTIERRSWRWLYIREDDGDLCRVAVRYVVSIETGPAIEAGWRKAKERLDKAAKGPQPALSEGEVEALLQRREGQP